ncbi:type I-F CRISPR-associated protein Csy1 [Pasteurella skyensis]|uniref:Type I-F CRISPR-associated protein Csy1 n=1 Tax=Phocoenobacter skyensis TaxID=97481 RepID=A0AAJ6NAG1_9PAST|nr:type I-F CRISPR-associated protein Csy1 [Pasteurella skyensis]MDP8163020.1 type I-F CRISPR-associated protein Csy1 [Pasteurella skyensis]MDP8173172.1 type I-F CRISPR-associated protein Csy1 [Pasteurella skyensis]MDP8176394.1 type I-F CRISPR-associated protein Csy1 [Pasteurella skyensis]MDP8178895.1 type I-F CRISPR-associated protein Csy1 [Pasteurella skyensis]MDP8183717.1 type I-F CRISPR-associated protein Csy1 [Pasteurella skyensis]
MPQIPSELTQNTVQNFLNSQFNKKTEKEQRQLEKAKESGSSDQIATLQEKLSKEREKYSSAIWLENAANKMAKQLYFGTHISKGVHPDAKGDNISFQSNHHLPIEIVGSHSIKSDYIDANGNAAALPLAAFFDFVVGEFANKQVKIRDLILEDNADFIASLSSDQTIAKSYHQAFKEALQNTVTSPVTHERNKQILWATNANVAESIEDLSYHNIVPLYPSVLTHELYQRINTLKYSEENKEAQDNRFKKTTEQKPYVTLSDLASVQLGGTKPQNVSLLMSKQGGRNYLLPSIPPTFSQRYLFNVSKSAKSIFNKNLAYQCYKPIEQFFQVIKSDKNTVDIREARKFAIDEILYILFSVSTYIKNTYPAGWSKDYQLDDSQKLWLDPLRANLEGEEEFAKDREELEWHLDIYRQFANWLNKLIQNKFPHLKHDTGKPEYNEWRREIMDMKEKYERAGKGVFL